MDMPAARPSAGDALGPATDRNRILDSVRALALFGVIVMNVGALVMRFAAPEVMARATPADLASMGLDLLLLQGKARSAFAFLFGVGFGLLMMRAKARGADFKAFYMRRMLALLGFGLFNQIFLFWGDILVLYALLGMLLVAARDWSDRAILIAGLFLIAAPPLAVGAMEAASGPLPNLLATMPAGWGDGGRILMKGDLVDIFMFNAPQTLLRYATDTPHMIIYALGVLGLFLVGFWAARRGIVFRPADHRHLLRRISMVALPVGLVLSALYATRLAGVRFEGAMAGLVTAAYVGLPILAFGYMAALALLFTTRAHRLQAFLAPAGRMGLTNYLLSGAIGGWIFYGYGLGLLREFSMLGINLVAIGLFLALTLFSHAWLARFRFGPAEWLWRSLSYGEAQPFSRGRSTRDPAT